jgi:hypothetical protein
MNEKLLQAVAMFLTSYVLSIVFVELLKKIWGKKWTQEK